MHTHLYTLSDLRAASHAGGVRSVVLKADGAVFSLRATTNLGDEAILVSTRKKEPRLFIDPRQAMSLLQEMGICKAEIDTANWHPEQADEHRQSRPDRAKVMKAAHEAADIKRVLEERIKLADDAKAIWHDADDVFAELEALHAG